MSWPSSIKLRRTRQAMLQFSQMEHLIERKICRGFNIEFRSTSGCCYINRMKFRLLPILCILQQYIKPFSNAAPNYHY